MWVRSAIPDSGPYRGLRAEEGARLMGAMGLIRKFYGERGSGFNDCLSLVLDLLEGADND